MLWIKELALHILEIAKLHSSQLFSGRYDWNTNKEAARKLIDHFQYYMNLPSPPQAAP